MHDGEPPLINPGERLTWSAKPDPIRYAVRKGTALFWGGRIIALGLAKRRRQIWCWPTTNSERRRREPSSETCAHVCRLGASRHRCSHCQFQQNDLLL